MMQRCGRTFSVEPTGGSAGTDVEAPDDTARSNQPDRDTRRAEEEGGARFSSPRDDKVGAPQGAIRARDVRAADLQKTARTQ